MTTLQFVSPISNSNVPAGQMGVVEVNIQKPITLLYYTVTFTISTMNSVVVWSGVGDNVGSQAKADLSWPSEPGTYTIEAVLTNAFNSELARIRTSFTVTKG